MCLRMKGVKGVRLKLICALAHQTRRGDRVMCMRFWGENTRETEASVRLRLFARAFHPKARSHDPITTPDAVGGTARSPIARSIVQMAATKATTATSSVRWVSDAAESRRRPAGPGDIRGVRYPMRAAG